MLINNRFKLTLYINYFVYAVLLNSVGIIILKSINLYGVSKVEASNLEFFKDSSIAIASFTIASLLPRVGYKNSMMIALALVIVAMINMYWFNDFLSAKILFAIIGASFAFIKISVYASVGILTDSVRSHNGLMSSIEGVFMFGIAASYFLFPAFNDASDVNAWLNVYIFLSATCLASILFLATVPNIKGEIVSGGIRAEIKSMFGLISQSLFAVFVISAFLFVMIEQGIMTWLPTFNREVLHIDEDNSIRLASILALSLGFGRLLAGKITEFVDWSTVLTVSILCAMAIVCFVLPKTLNSDLDSNSIVIFGISLVGFIFPLVGIFIGPIYPLLNSAVLSSLPKPMHSSMAALIIISSALGGTLGSIITAFLFETLEGGAFYFNILPMTLLLISVQWLRGLTSKSQP
jgi:fucose permease